MRTALLLSGLLVGCSDYDLHRPDKSNPEEEEPVVEEEEEETLDPDIELSPTSVEFGYLPKDCVTEWTPVTISNVGGAELIVETIEIAGSGSSGFELNPEDLPAEGAALEIAPGDSVTVRVRFGPEAWVTYEPQLSVASNDPDEPTARAELSGIGAEDALYEQTFTQDLQDQVDVMWIVDNSGSMSDDLVTVGNNFEAFIQVFIDYDLDYQMGVITTDMDNPAQSGRLVGPYITPATPDPVATFVDQIDLGATGSGSEQGFEALQAALTSPILTNENAGFMRPDAAIAAIVVSDEGNSSLQTADQFVTWFEALKPHRDLTTFSAICEQLFIDCGNYASAADLTGGITGDIAASDYSTVLDQIALTTAGMTVSFDLDEAPSDLSQTVVTVEGAAVPNNSVDGWQYDSADQAIVFNGAAIPQPGESGSIVYPTASECP